VSTDTAPVAALVHDHFQGPTGMGRVLERHAYFLLEEGWNVVLVGANVPDDLTKQCTVAPTPVFRRLPALPQHVAWCAAAATTLRGVTADVVHVHSPLLMRFADLMTCHFLAGPAFARGVRETRRGLEGRLRRLQAAGTKALDDKLYHRLPRRTHLSFVSEFLRDEFRARYGRPRGDWVLAPPAQPFRPVSSEARTAARRRWSCPDEGIVVGYLGGDDPRKGLEDAVALGMHGGAFVLLAGPGTSSLNLRHGRGVGFVDLDDLLEACDVVVAPALFDSAPVAVLHALSRGLPAVVTPTTGWAPAIERHGAGIVWTRSEPLLKAVQAAALVPADACRSLVADFHEDLQRQRLLEAYRSIVDGSS
jgi:glycosyltransferase involved in cell wall biosynthesis